MRRSRLTRKMPRFRYLCRGASRALKADRIKTSRRNTRRYRELSLSASRSTNKSRTTPIFHAYRPSRDWLAAQKTGCTVLYLQRSRHLVFIRALFAFRPPHRYRLASKPSKYFIEICFPNLLEAVKVNTSSPRNKRVFRGLPGTPVRFPSLSSTPELTISRYF